MLIGVHFSTCTCICIYFAKIYTIHVYIIYLMHLLTFSQKLLILVLIYCKQITNDDDYMN